VDAYRIGDPDQHTIVVRYNDITDRKQAAEKMLESHERLEKVLQVEAVGVIFWDLSTGCLVDANNTFLKMMGYSRSDIKSRSLTWQILKPPEYQKVSLDEIHKFQQTGRVGPYEKEYFRKDGVRQWLLFSGSSLGGNQCVEFCIDISKRKKAEEELSAANNQVQSIIDNTTAIIYALDLEERFVLVNVPFAKLLKSTPEKMIGKRRHLFMSGEDADRHEKNDRTVIEKGKVIEFEEYSYLNGQTITWLTTKFPLYDAKGNISAVAGTSADISDHKRLEDDLKKYNATLEDRVRERTEDLQKLNEALSKSNKELENFAYITSHDLQEPLRMVTNFTQLLENKYSNQINQDAKEYIGFAVDGAKRMYELINGLLSYSRINRNDARFADVDLNKVISEVRANLYLIIKERNCLIESDDLPVVFADRTQMLQLFQNLISNGIKFSGKDPHIIISVRKEGSNNVFSVKDEGIGIESTYFDKIFEIFKRLHPRDEYPGTGMGLAICKKIVENSNGKIWVQSEPDRGSEFHFTLNGAGNLNIRSWYYSESPILSGSNRRIS
jgi:PAS domain S-box-containing protein